MKVNRKARALIVLISFLLLFGAGRAWADVGATIPSYSIQVSETSATVVIPDDYDTIQAALESSELDGTTDPVILVRSTYDSSKEDETSSYDHENGDTRSYLVKIDPTESDQGWSGELTLVSEDGPGETTVNAYGADYGIAVEGDGTEAKIKGFEVKNFDNVGILAGSWRNVNNGSYVNPEEVDIIHNILGRGPFDKFTYGIELSYTTTGTIKDNTLAMQGLTEKKEVGAILVAETSDVVVKNNVINNGEESDELGIAVVTFGGLFGVSVPVKNLLIKNNTITGGKQGIGIEAYDSQEVDGTVIEDNNITGSETSIDLKEKWSSVDNGSIKNTTITNNELNSVNNHEVDDTLDATKNWWGTAYPFFDQIIEGNVDYSPWYVDSGRTYLSENLDTHTVEKGNSIQAAIEAANLGDTIEVGPGTYNESIKIRTNGLTLRGIEGPSGNAPVIIGDGESVGNQPHAAIHIDDGSDHVRNVTIEGFTVENPDGKYGIFAGTGTTNSNSDGIGGLVVQNNVIKNISTSSSGGSLTGGPAGIGIRGDYGTDGHPGIEISNNEVSNVESSGWTNAVGITLKSFTGDAGFGKDSSGNDATDSASPPATDTDIVDNDISNIAGGGGSRTKGISVSGEFEEALVEDNTINQISASGSEASGGKALAITFTENSDSYSGNEYDIDGDGNGERIGPRAFEIKENDINQIDASSAVSVFIGGYEDLGNHAVTQNNFLTKGVGRVADSAQDGFQDGDGDTLDATNNYWGSAENPASKVSAKVAFSPWLGADIDTSPMTHIVADESPEPTSGFIQDAINAASSGDTVKVVDGTYDGSVSIDKPLDLIAASGRPKIDRSSATHDSDGIDETILQIKAPNVTVEGFELVGGTGTGTGISIQVNNAPRGVSVLDNIISDVKGGGGGDKKESYGILAWASSKRLEEITIAGNTIKKLGGDDEGPSTQGMGISLEEIVPAFQGDGATIRDNTIKEVSGYTNTSDSRYPGVGIALLPTKADPSNSGLLSPIAANAEIEKNVVKDSGVGISVAGDVRPLGIHGNHIENNDWGLITKGQNPDEGGIGIMSVDSAASQISNGPVDAVHNYWGDWSGPSGGVDDPVTETTADGSGDKVTGGVNFDPWLHDPMMSFTKQKMDFVSGWQMVSPNVTPFDTRPDAVFKEYLGNVFAYDPGNGYVPGDEMGRVSSTDGFWVYATNPNTGGDLEVDGVTPTGDWELEFTAGGETWHMFSVPFDTFWSSVSFTAPGIEEELAPNEASSDANDLIYDTIYTFNTDYDANDPDSEPYKQVAYTTEGSDVGLLEADKGYWIRVDAVSDDTPVTMTIPHKPGNTPSSSSSAMDAATVSKPVPEDAPQPPVPPMINQASGELKATAAVNNEAVSFEVAGKEVSSISVQVFDMDGQKVFSGTSAGNKLSWDADVPNGVYLYGTTAEVNGETKPLGIQKLLVLR